MASQRIKGITIEIDGNVTPLQKALEDVDKSLAETQSSLRDVNKLLKLDPTNTELLRQKTERLNRSIADSEDKVKSLRTAQEQLGDRTEKNADQYDAIEREIIACEQAQKKWKDELKAMEPQVKTLKDSLKDVSKTTGEMSKATKGLSMGAGIAAGGLLANAFNSAAAADDLATMSKNLGISVEELQKMQYASDRVDVSVDQMAGSMSKLTKQMGSNSKVFEEYGIQIYNADGTMRDATDVWYDSLDALSKIENGTERDQAAMALFGKSAMEMSGIVDDGGAALKAYGEEAENAGLIMSQDAVDGAVRFNDAVDKLKATTGAAIMEAGASLAETLAPALELIVEKVTAVLQWFSDLDGTTQVVILTILGLVAAISPVLGLISTLTSLAAGLNVAMLPMIGTIAGIVAAIVAVVAIGVTLYKNWDTVKKKAGELWKSISDTFENIRKSIGEKIDAARKAVKDAIEAIKGFFNFNWKLPELKMPHFKVSGSLNPIDWLEKGLPHFQVDWYAKAMRNGMILTNPTIFGMQNGRLLGGGEAGSETVVGTGSLMNMISNAVSAGSSPTINVVVNGADNPEDWGRRLVKQMKLEVRTV